MSLCDNIGNIFLTKDKANLFSGDDLTDALVCLNALLFACARSAILAV